MGYKLRYRYLNHLGVKFVVHHPLEAPGGVAEGGGGEAVLLNVGSPAGPEAWVLGLDQLA